ncbi:hypothetical protein F8S09_03800 [Deinococcus sp. SDU3-2]|uniref:DUF7079 domain-containing protein n=1 Tax=Deinococcus terrestris TaxID=2651870 RepID=A0A7X1NU32_9DEIO|nr:hypothetical protein [Deinococcus terrestris]MPY65822.1 hypothetical protein [Deinococcus terrestris]
MPPAPPRPPAELSGAELRRRRPLWVALSELWLDQELSPADLRRVARVAAACGYDDAEVEAIFWGEVAPVVAGNLLAPVGVWSGFDEDWLCERAARSAAYRSRPSLTRWLTRLWAGRLVEREWKHLLALLPVARAERQAGHPAPGGWPEESSE